MEAEVHGARDPRGPEGGDHRRLHLAARKGPHEKPPSREQRRAGVCGVVDQQHALGALREPEAVGDRHALPLGGPVGRPQPLPQLGLAQGTPHEPGLRLQDGPRAALSGLAAAMGRKLDDGRGEVASAGLADLPGSLGQVRDAVRPVAGGLHQPGQPQRLIAKTFERELEQFH